MTLPQVDVTGWLTFRVLPGVSRRRKANPSREADGHPDECTETAQVPPRASALLCVWVRSTTEDRAPAHPYALGARALINPIFVRWPRLIAGGRRIGVAHKKSKAIRNRLTPQGILRCMKKHRRL